MKQINIHNIAAIPIANSSSGILVSGGVDSAILLYFLLKNVSTTLHIFTTASQEKKLITTKHAVDVVGKCAELTNNYNFQHHIYYVKSQNTNLFNLPKDFMSKNIINYCYTGVTKNPLDFILKTFNNPSTENHDAPLGNIETGFKLFDKPMSCITESCVSSADSKIPKRKN